MPWQMKHFQILRIVCKRSVRLHFRRIILLQGTVQTLRAAEHPVQSQQSSVKCFQNSIILRYSFQGYDKSISSGKAIQEQRQCSSSSIQGHLGSLQPMIFLRKMRGISEMHLSVQTIRTCKKVFTKQQSIWKCFSEIYFWTRKTSFIIEIFI